MKLKLLAITLLTTSLFSDSEQVPFEIRPLPLEVPELISEETENDADYWSTKLADYIDLFEVELVNALTNEFKESEDVSEIIKGMESIIERDFSSTVDLTPKVLLSLLSLNNLNDLDDELLNLIQPGIEEINGYIGNAEKQIELLAVQFKMFAEKVLDLTASYPEDDFAKEISRYFGMYNLPELQQSVKDTLFLKDGALSFEKYPEFQLALTDLMRCIYVDSIMDDVLENLDFEDFEEELDSFTANKIRERVLPHFKGSEHPLFSVIPLKSLEEFLINDNAKLFETSQNEMLMRLEELNNGSALEISDFEEAFMELVVAYSEETMERLNEISMFLDVDFS